jgi:hypothetical protein
MLAAAKAGLDEQQVKVQILELMSSGPTGQQFLKTVLAHTMKR